MALYTPFHVRKQQWRLLFIALFIQTVVALSASATRSNRPTPSVTASVTASASITRSISTSGSVTPSASTSPSISASPTTSPSSSLTPTSSGMIPGNMYTFGGVCGGGGWTNPLAVIGKPATSEILGYLWAIAVDKHSNIYYTLAIIPLVMKISANTNLVSLVAGGGSNHITSYSDAYPATSVSFYDGLGQLAIDSKDNVYIVWFDMIFQLTKTTGMVRMFAGGYDYGYSGDGGSASNARFYSIAGIVFDAHDNLYIADNGNNVIRKITSSTGIVSRIVGGSDWGYSGDGGLAGLAQILGPSGIVIEPHSGDIIFTDSDNHAIRRISNATGIITTIAGSPPDGGFDGDGGPATSALMSWPYGLAIDAWGSVYFSDINNKVIRRVDANSGVITGITGYGTSTDGPAYNGSFLDPETIGVTHGGDLLVADIQLSCIRIIYRGAASPASTPSSTPSHSPTRSVTPTHSLSRTKTATHTPTASRSHTVRSTPTHTATSTQSLSRSATASYSRTHTASRTSSASPRATVSTSMSRKAKST